MSVEGLNTEKVEEPTTLENQEPSVDMNELLKKVDALQSSNERLLNESKTWKSKYQSVKTEVETTEEERMKANKDLEGLVGLEKKKREEFESKYQTLQKDFARERLINEVSQHAKDAHDVGDIYSNLSNDLVRYDDESKKFLGVEDAVKQLRVEKSYLFGKEVIPGMATERPAVVKPQNIDEKIKEDPMGVLGASLEKFLI